VSKANSAQIAAAKKAAALKTKNVKHGLSPGLIAANQRAQARAALAAESAVDQPKPDHVHAPRGPPGLRLLDKAEVCSIANVTFPTIWAWMRRGQFPRSRIVGGKSMWRSDEVAAWMSALPVRPLKGDQREAAAS
jgi:predicted DNA-binding transcriptional regulator AlpA